ncbi:hypothetical protein R70006_06251 [Paraburkholderia domus]|uniref:hypothetical protein n=1 Tax=Paraburkholderia domus TaxID=2793075 RepID=UPI0019144A58|nr:hypothetical protein [Paraburkholderia domus]MBK5052883.1 hypothetical protein [Burkholderia sp. R-70006]CAE6822118.1 hypothetical protein R70006_06251 [Paraburkholderia domus]
MPGTSLSGSSDVLLQIDAERERLQKAGDILIKDLEQRGNTFPADQREGFQRVLGTVIEHTDSLNFAREGIVNNFIGADEPEVTALLATAGAISSRILAAAA